MAAEPVWVMLLSARLGKGPVFEPLLSYRHDADSRICRVVLVRRAPPVSPMLFPFRLQAAKRAGCVRGRCGW